MKSWRPWQTYREALIHFYFVRRNKNSKYSMRAYARDLKISASRLNGILKGKFGLSYEAAKSISESLKLTYGDKILFQYMVESEHGRSKVSRLTAKKFVERNIQLPSIDEVEFKKYKPVLSWKNFALLEMIENPRFKNDITWISNSLGLEPVEIQRLLNNLIKSGAVEKVGDQFKKKEDFVYVAGTNKVEAIKNFQYEILKKIEKSIAQENSDSVAFGTWIISIDKKRVPEAQHVMNEFLQEFCKKFGRLGLPPSDDPFKDRDSIYSISGYLIPLGHLDKPPT